jgi:hypothetical protein
VVFAAGVVVIFRLSYHHGCKILDWNRELILLDELSTDGAAEQEE